MIQEKNSQGKPEQFDSHYRRLYLDQFLDKSSITYEELRTAMTHRFDLGKLDSVFSSWTAALPKDDKFCFSFDNKIPFNAVIFEYDHHWFRSDVQITHCIQKHRQERLLSIKLP
jgi:hypothetical protein